jgi:hypothetical protein
MMRRARNLAATTMMGLGTLRGMMAMMLQLRHHRHHFLLGGAGRLQPLFQFHSALQLRQGPAAGLQRQL